MGYIIKILAILPALSVGLSTIALVLVAFATDYYWILLLCAFNSIGFILLAENYEYTVKVFLNLLKILCDKTPVYKD